MEAKAVFQRLWHEYTSQNPSVAKIFDLFVNEGETDILHDHVAYRTFNHPQVNAERIADLFKQLGYKQGQDYYFEKKKLKARHYEHPDERLPKIFISELLVEEFSPFLQDTVAQWMENVPAGVADDMSFLWANNPWNEKSFEVYSRLREESEYAAWMYVYGFRINHFAIYINHLKHYTDIRKVNDFIKNNGYTLNQSGGEIKGSKEKYLEQSSIMAEKIRVLFNEGIYEIPACYYEFTQRYPKPDNKLYTGFYASSADKIFESTNFYK